MESLPTGAVTFLFTDIEGSTAAWEARPEETAADVELHDRLLREQIESNAGYVFATGGDSFSAAFASPSSALTAAKAAQRSLAASEVGVSVRMGVHTGEAVERDGNYFGPPLNRTARLMSLGHGGQVLVSPATQSLVLGDGFSFIDLGEHRLADLAEPIRVAQLVGEGLEVSFAPLRSAVETNNLPLLGEVFGREADINNLSDMLDQSRLVTLVGAGGIGKTTLALATAARVLDDYTDGCWLIDLTDLSPSAGASSITAAVSAVDSRFSDVSKLAARRMLMMFDNCEHVLDGVSGYLEGLLRGSSDVRVVATSREPLAVPGERVMRVEPLSTVEGSTRASAVDLFAARAAAAGGSILMERDRAEVAGICRSVGGLPLAIELAAARTNVMTVAEIKDRLSDRLSVLRGGTSGPAHHETIEAAVAWSYDLLEPDTQALLRLLSVYDGGFGLDMAEAMGTESNGAQPPVIDRLSDLVRKSLIQHDESRFGMLESVRQFAAARLTTAGEQAACQGKHFEYFAKWASDVHRRDLLRTGLTTEDRQWVTANVANLRSAVRWGAENEQLVGAAEISEVLWIHYLAQRLGQYDGEDWYQPLLPYLEQLEPELQIGVLHQWSAIEAMSGNSQLSLDLLNREHDIYIEVGSPPLRGVGVFNNLGLAAFWDGRWADSERWYRASIEDSKKAGVGYAIPLGNLARTVNLVHNDPKGALKLLKEADPSASNPDHVAWSPEYLGLARAEALISLGDLDSAWKEGSSSLANLRKRQVGFGTQAEILVTLSTIEVERRDLRGAAMLLLEAFDLETSGQIDASWRRDEGVRLAQGMLAMGHPNIASLVLEDYLTEIPVAIPPVAQTMADDLETRIQEALAHIEDERLDSDHPIEDLILEALHTYISPTANPTNSHDP